jgi:pimeloyl-ACP methyl ester carboxylesterase
VSSSAAPPILLVHGAWHGAWCWERVVPLLENAGRRVVAIDLPGLGADTTPPERVTLDAYAERICAALTDIGEPAVVVGHSMGGIAISQAAERCPERVAHLVYLTAFLLTDGETLLSVAETDPEALVPPNIVLNDAHTAATLRPESLAEALYGDCSEDDVAWASARLVPQAAAPLGTPLHVTEALWGAIPRTYVHCTDDRAITLGCQMQMVARVGVGTVKTLAASHSPFLSMPGPVAEIIGAAR